MDDTARTTREFTIGGEAGIKVSATRPTEDQLFVLSMSRTSDSSENRRRLLQRLLRILESLTGSDVWYGVVEDALIDGRITSAELMKFADEVLFHKWEDEPAPEPDAAGVDLPGDGA